MPLMCMVFRAAGLSANGDEPTDLQTVARPGSRRRIAHPSAWFGRGTSALRQPTVAILLRREGIVANHKSVERVYREEGLSLRLKRRRKRVNHLLMRPPSPMGPNQHWAMDFMSDCLMNGRRLRMLTVVDFYDRCCPVIIRTDNGPEFTGKALDLWAQGLGVRLEFIRKGKPTENGHIESFQDRFREEGLNAQAFFSLA